MLIYNAAEPKTMCCGGLQDLRRDFLVYSTPGPTKERGRSSGNARHIPDIYARAREGRGNNLSLRRVFEWDERGK